MAICKFCHAPLDWGQKDDGRFVPLVPMDSHDGLVRSFQDENGELRAEHRLVCVGRGGPTVRVVKLARNVEPWQLPHSPSGPTDPDTGEVHEPLPVSEAKTHRRTKAKTHRRTKAPPSP